MFEFSVPYSQRYLFNAIPDANYSRNFNSKVTLTLLTLPTLLTLLTIILGSVVYMAP